VEGAARNIAKGWVFVLMSGAVLPLGRCEFCEQRASRPPSQGGVPRRGRPAPLSHGLRVAAPPDAVHAASADLGDLRDRYDKTQAVTPRLHTERARLLTSALS